MKRRNLNAFNRVSVIGASAFLAFGCSMSGTKDPGPTQTGGTGSPPTSSSGISVTTYHNDQARTGQNLNESVLTRDNVNSTSFGKVGALPVDGQVFAQPLYMQNVQVNGASKNLVFVVTEHDSVYAFDADAATTASGQVTTPLWKRSFLGDSGWQCPTAPCVTLGIKDTLAPNIYPEVGITATPVIDTDIGIMYVTSVDKEGTQDNGDGTYGTINMYIHAISITTGEEQKGSPTLISAAVPVGPVLPDIVNEGAGKQSDGLIHFQARFHLSRAGLVLSNGIVYVSMTSWNDLEPDHGWVFGYDEIKLTQVSTYITTPSSGNGTIWMSGGAPAVDDAGNLYFATGSGDAAYQGNAGSTSPDLADSILKISVGGSSGLQLSDYFTPYNWKALAQGDVDLGAGGVMLLPDQSGSTTHLLVSGGKQGTIYVLNRDNMGKVAPAGATSDTQLAALGGASNTTVVAGGTNHGPGLYGTPSYFNGNVFMMPAVSGITSIPVTSSGLDFANAKKSTLIEKQRGSTTSISANGASDGIVWYIDPSAYLYSYNYAASPGTGGMTITANGPGILTAFSTDDLSKPLYQSNATEGNAQAAGDAIKFSVPTIANGLVFVGTQTELSIFGLKDRTKAAAAASESAKNSKNADRSFASVTISKIEKFEQMLAEKLKNWSFNF